MVELKIRYGEYGRDLKTVAVHVDDELSRDLLGSVELSDDPFSLFVASRNGNDAVAVRRRVFRMRHDVARRIADAMVPEIMRVFEADDELNGYRIDDTA